MKFTISALLSLTVVISAVITMPANGFAEEPSLEDANELTTENNGEKSNLVILSPKSEKEQVAQIFGAEKQPKPPGDNYVGLATVIGGDTDFIDAAIISKVKVLNLDSSKSVSVRPSAVFSNGDLDVRIPATLDLNRINRDLGELNGRVTPYAGGGVAIDSDGDADLMLTAGMDVQLTPRITGTAAANVLFLGDTEFDATVGVGYNF